MLSSCGKHETRTPNLSKITLNENIPALSLSEQALLSVQSDNLEEFKSLIQGHDLNLNLRHQNGRTYLIEAVLWSRLSFIKWLLEQETIDIQAKDVQGKSALEHAEYIGNREIISALNGGSMSQEEIDESLFQALYAKNHDAVKEAIAAGADLNIFDKKGLTPLILAIYQKDELAVRLLLQTRKIDVNLADKRTMKRPLAWAKRAKLERVQKMLERLGAQM